MLQCTLQYSATGSTGWYAVALQIEDFVSTSSTIPLSSVPLQFLILVFTSTSSCNRRPEFVAPTRVDGSCIGIPFSTTWHESIIATSGAAGVRYVHGWMNDVYILCTVYTDHATHISVMLHCEQFCCLLDLYDVFCLATYTNTAQYAVCHRFCTPNKDHIGWNIGCVY